MTRSVTSAFQAQVEGDSLTPFYAVKMEFPDETTLRYWTGYRDITFDSQTFTGLSDFINIDIASETLELAATGASVTVSGINAATISLALGEPYQGNPLAIWFGVLDGSGDVIADPYMVFEGKMDVMNINADGTGSSVVITAESNLIDLNRSRIRRYTPEDQKIDHPNDKGFDFTPSIQDVTIAWGRPSN